jgi:DNA-binding transcriptional MerR regulator
METELTIQQVAARTGLSVHTLRYYERNGLLEPVNRAANGHRRYSAEDITRIEFLTRLRTTGMPIRQMQQFATLLRQQPEAISDRRLILEMHEREVQQRIQELSRNLAAIQWKIQHYKELEARNKTEYAYIHHQDEPANCLAEGNSHNRSELIPSEAEIIEPEQIHAAIPTHNSLNGSSDLKH